jgi:hypothetical protein
MRERGMLSPSDYRRWKMNDNIGRLLAFLTISIAYQKSRTSPPELPAHSGTTDAFPAAQHTVART